MTNFIIMILMGKKREYCGIQANKKARCKRAFLHFFYSAVLIKGHAAKSA